MITKLTKEQEDNIAVYREKYFQIGSSTEPINEEELKKAITSSYLMINEKEPAFIFCDSPLTSIITISLLSSNERLSSLRSSLRSSLGSSLDSSLGSSLDSSLWSSLDSSFDSSLGSSLRSSLGSSLDSSLGSSIDSSLGSSLRLSLWSSLDSLAQIRHDNDYFYGSINAYWIAYYKYCEHIGVEYDVKSLSILKMWEVIAQHGFHWWPKKGLCVCSRKPIKIRWNNASIPILHADGEMSVQFADGWGIYSFNGVLMPEQYGKVKSTDWDPNWILAEQNQEVKRVLLENIPKEKISEVLKLKTIDTWKSSISTYELVEAENNPYPSRYRALKMTCPSTNKPYLIRVHPDMESAERAVVEFNGGVHPDSFIMEH